jgi:hypothetical protein
MINPPWLSKDENIWHGVKSAMPPLGLLSVAAYVETKGYCVRVIDVHIEKYTAAELIEKLKVARPRFVGMSVMTATSNAANQIAYRQEDRSKLHRGLRRRSSRGHARRDLVQLRSRYRCPR